MSCFLGLDTTGRRGVGRRGLDDELDFFKMTLPTTERDHEGTFSAFKEDKYKVEWLLIGRFLSTLTTDPLWTKEEA